MLHLLQYCFEVMLVRDFLSNNIFPYRKPKTCSDFIKLQVNIVSVNLLDIQDDFDSEYDLL